MISGIQLTVQIGDYEFTRSHVFIRYDRRDFISTANIILSDADRSAESKIEEGQEVSILFGFRSGDHGRFKGIVWKKRIDKDCVEITVIGMENPGRKKIKQTWINETPESIISYSLADAGFSIGRIDSTGCTFEKFVSSNHTIVDIARICASVCYRSYGVNMSRWDLWMDGEGKVNWGNFSNPANELPVIETGKGLIEHKPSQMKCFDSLVFSFLMPDFMHSMDFQLIDRSRGIDAVYRALMVEHELTDKARTVIGYDSKFQSS